MTTTPTSGAADLPEALRRSTAADGKTELFNLPGYPLMVRAVDFNRIHAENETLRAGYAAARLEIESLRERVQQPARDVNSRRVTELDAQLGRWGGWR